MYQKILNPANGKNVSIYSNLGKSIINNYLLQSGGSGLRPGFLLNAPLRRAVLEAPTPVQVPAVVDEPILGPASPVNFDRLPNELKKYIIDFLEDPNSPEPLRTTNKCKNIGRYCQTNKELRDTCRDSTDIRRTISQCKQHKVHQIRAKRQMNHPRSMAGSMQNRAIANEWELSDELSIPTSLHRIAELLQVPKYCYVSKTRGFIIETDNLVDIRTLPKYGYTIR